MDFYLEALDRKEKKENENPSVGVILCATKDEKVVEYAMSEACHQRWYFEIDKQKIIRK